MKKSSTIRARMEPDLKNKAEYIFRKLGLTTTQALTIFYRQVELRSGLPFDVAIPNETTRRTLADTDSGRNLVVCEDADDMFKKLGI
ncbi:MAG: type II toxin-antitoxin system RelB/DinJ family antitoxin [Thermodesulfobacteriota bacterium]|nr:type II toxin-antitoxin system RelB/DinJ family antitoxin [Thermodesulfobacteriota bacterium]